MICDECKRIITSKNANCFNNGFNYFHGSIFKIRADLSDRGSYTIYFEPSSLKYAKYEIPANNVLLKNLPFTSYFNWGGFNSSKSAPITLDQLFEIILSIDRVEKLTSFQ